MQVFLHPSNKSLRWLESILSCREARKVREEVEQSIIAWAHIVAEAKNKQAVIGCSDTLDAREPSRKQPRSPCQASVHNSATSVFSFGEFEDSDISLQSNEATLMDKVVEEVKSYQENERVPAKDLPTRRPLKWWKAMRCRYPNLSVVAQSILAHPASSA